MHEFWTTLCACIVALLIINGIDYLEEYLEKRSERKNNSDE